MDKMKRISFIVLSLLTHNLLASECSDQIKDIKKFFKDSKILQKEFFDKEDIKRYFEFTGNIGLSKTNCSKKELAIVNQFDADVKLKRIETIAKYFKQPISQLSGEQLVEEYKVLTGQMPIEKANDLSVEHIAIDDFLEVPIKLPNLLKLSESQLISGIQNIAQKNIQDNREKCGPDRINENEAVNHQTIRNQSGVGWCYAYTASDLVSYALNRRISGISMHVSNRHPLMDQVRDDANAGGQIEEAINFQRDFKKGFCLESKLQSTISLDEAKRLKETFLLLDQFKKKPEQCEIFVADPIFQIYKTLFPNLDLKIFFEKSWEEIIDSSCAERIELPNRFRVKAIKYFGGGDSQSIGLIHEQLNLNNILGVSLNMEKLVDGVVTDNSNHALTLVGRKINHKTGLCEFVIRNSWGKFCGLKQSDELSCEYENGKPTGFFMISESELMKSLKGITFLSTF